MGAEDVTIAFRPSFDLSLIGAAVSLSIGFLAAIVPGWQASQTEIVTALGRNEYALFGGNRLDNDECRIVSFE